MCKATNIFWVVNAALKGIYLQMTGGTAHQRIGVCAARYAAIVKQIPAQLNALHRHGVVSRDVHAGRETKGISIS